MKTVRYLLNVIIKNKVCPRFSKIFILSLINACSQVRRHIEFKANENEADVRRRTVFTMAHNV